MILERGKNNYIETFFRFIKEEDKANIEYFYLESSKRTYRPVDSGADISTLLLNDELSYEDNEFLLNYSGFNYRHINATLRKIWNYEENGAINKKYSYDVVAQNLQRVINNHPTTLLDNIIVYRGVDLSYFRSYGIETLEDLKQLEDKYILDRGFVSTSLLEKDCFFKKDNDWGLNYNIKIEYMIPQEFKDGIYLSKVSSYTPQQHEFLINTSNLSKINSVSIDEDTAIISTTIIPKEVYDPYYRERVNNQSYSNK